MRSVCLFIAAVALLGCQPTGAPAFPSVDELIESHAHALLKDDRFHSVSIGVIHEENRYVRHFGELTIGLGDRPNDQSIYEIASVTKTFVGTLAAKAVLENKLQLEDDVRVYLNGLDANLADLGQPVTIRHLLTHTSGFPNFPPRGESKQAYLNSLKDLTLNSKPGSRYAYSNMAPELLAYILETVYATPFESLVQRHILTPLEMTSSGYMLTREQEGNLVQGYNDKRETMPHFEKTLWGGMAGLHATLPDLMKYMAFQLDDSVAVVSESHRELYDIDRDTAIAYFWHVDKSDAALSYSHHGGIWGMQNWIVVYPEHNIGISIASNSSFNDAGDILAKTVEGIFADLVEFELQE